MTPTEQDKELREQIERLFSSLEPYRLENTDSELDMYRVTKVQFSRMKDDVMQLITADRKRVALEARIDELRLASDMQHMMRRADRVNYCSKRIAELKAQQEESDDKS